jgi:hypothetical protein
VHVGGKEVDSLCIQDWQAFEEVDHQNVESYSAVRAIDLSM